MKYTFRETLKCSKIGLLSLIVLRCVGPKVTEQENDQIFEANAY